MFIQQPLSERKLFASILTGMASTNGLNIALRRMLHFVLLVGYFPLNTLNRHSIALAFATGRAPLTSVRACQNIISQNAIRKQWKIGELFGENY